MWSSAKLLLLPYGCRCCNATGQYLWRMETPRWQGWVLLVDPLLLFRPLGCATIVMPGTGWMFQWACTKQCIGGGACWDRAPRVTSSKIKSHWRSSFHTRKGDFLRVCSMMNASELSIHVRPHHKLHPRLLTAEDRTHQKLSTSLWRLKLHASLPESGLS